MSLFVIVICLYCEFMFVKVLMKDYKFVLWMGWLPINYSPSINNPNDWFFVPCDKVSGNLLITDVSICRHSEFSLRALSTESKKYLLPFFISAIFTLLFWTSIYSFLFALWNYLKFEIPKSMCKRGLFVAMQFSIR